MDGSVRSVCLMSKHFHNVDFPAPGPLAVQVLIGGHHPECRQEPLSFGNLHPGFKQAIFKVMLILRINAPGSIGYGSVFLLRFHRLYHQVSVFQENVFFRIHICLQLAVYPSGIVGFHIPVFPVQGRSIEGIFPFQLISVIG